MKKIYPIILLMLIFVLALCLVSCNFNFTITSTETTPDETAEPEPEPRLNKVAVISDIHLIATDDITTQEEYDYISTCDNKCPEFSLAALQTVINEIIARGDIKTVLIPGDLSLLGHTEQHITVETYLQQFNKAGIKVFVINGNHDIAYNTDADFTLANFKELYAPYGYSNAISVHEDTASYSADIQDDIRLIAIDNNSYNTDCTTESYMEYPCETIHAWIEQELIRAKTDGKRVIVMYHQPYQSQIISNIHAGVGKYCNDIMDLFIKYGVKVTLCGHNHGQSVTSYSTDAGTVYEIMTSSTICTAPSYRTMDFYEETVQIESFKIEKLNAEYISEFCPAEVLEQVTTDYATYATQKVGEITKTYITGYATSYLGSMPAIKKSVTGVLKMQLYGEDSLESLMQEYGVTIPKTSYETCLDLIPFFIENLLSGDQIVALDAPESELLKYVMYAMIYKLQNKLNKILPEEQAININFEEFFTTGKLEAIQSGFINGLVTYIDSLEVINFDFSKINFTTLEAFVTLAPALDTMILPNMKLFDSMKSYITTDSFMMSEIIENVVMGNILGDIYTSGLADNNITLDF